MIVRTPYAQLLGIETVDVGDEPFMLKMPASPALEGRTGFLYGGVIASLLELACLEAMAQDHSEPWPKPINMSFDFMRGGLMIDSYARARLMRVGRRVMNVEAICWQTDQRKPIAIGRMHLLLD